MIIIPIQQKTLYYLSFQYYLPFSPCCCRCPSCCFISFALAFLLSLCCCIALFFYSILLYPWWIRIPFRSNPPHWCLSFLHCTCYPLFLSLIFSSPFLFLFIPFFFLSFNQSINQSINMSPSVLRWLDSSNWWTMPSVSLRQFPLHIQSNSITYTHFRTISFRQKLPWPPYRG